MSQVKKTIPKFQSGGSNQENTTPQEKAYGKYKMNGRELDGKLAILRLSAIAQSVPLRQRESFSVAKRALEEGHNVEYDPDKNVIIVRNTAGQELTRDYTNTKANYNNSWIKREWGAWTQDEADQFKRGLRSFVLIDMSPEAPVKTPGPTKIKLRKGKGWYAYDTDDKGNKTYRENSPTNEGIRAHLEQMRAYFDDPNPDTLLERYELGPYKQEILDSFRAVYDRVPDKDAFWKAFEDNAKANKLNSNQKEILNLFGYEEGKKDDSDAEGDPKPGDVAYIDPKVESELGISPDALRSVGLGMSLQNNRWRLTGSEDNPFLANYWYLDNIPLFANTKWRDGFIGDDGYLYTAKESQNDKLFTGLPFFEALNRWRLAQNNINNVNWDQTYNARIASGIRFAGDRQDTTMLNAYGIEDPETFYGAYTSMYNPQTHYNELLYKYFKDAPGNYYYNVLNGSFDNLGNRQIFSYIPHGENRRFNDAAVEIPYYVIYDPTQTTNPYTMFQDENSFLNNLSSLGITPRTSSWTIVGEPQQTNPWEQTPDKNQRYAVYFTFGSDGKQNTLGIGEDGKFYVWRKGTDGKNLKPIFIDQDKAMQILHDPVAQQTYTYDWLLKNTPEEQKAEQRANDYAILSSMFKQGGNIPKYSVGGTTVTKTTSMSSEDIKTDVTKAHALDGSDGGLTDAERMQIGAAIGDLSGVVMSFFGPAGQVAGAITGAGASTTRFIGDIKQDGFQWSDLKNYGINLGLDVATAVSGNVGKGFKVARVLNSIRKLSKPVLTALALQGASSAIISSVQKWANGEKYTSKDLANIIQGLSSLVVGTKGAKDYIGNARLAKTAEKNALSKINAQMSAPKEVKIGDTSVKATPKQVSDFVEANPTKQKAIEGFIGHVKANNGVDITPEQAEKALKEFGVDIPEKGKLKFSWNPKKWFHTRGEIEAKYDIPEEKTPHSTFRYLIDPFARAKQLGSKNVFGFGKHKGNLDTITADDYIAAVSRRSRIGRSRLEDQALMRLSMESPESFGNLFNANSTPSRIIWGNNNGWGFLGPRYYRYPQSSFEVVPLPKWNLSIPYSDQLEIIPYHFKKGGKIIKGQGGWKTVPSTLNYGQNQDNMWLSLLYGSSNDFTFNSDHFHYKNFGNGNYYSYLNGRNTSSNTEDNPANGNSAGSNPNNGNPNSDSNPIGGNSNRGDSSFNGSNPADGNTSAGTTPTNSSTTPDGGNSSGRINSFRNFSLDIPTSSFNLDLSNANFTPTGNTSVSSGTTPSRGNSFNSDNSFSNTSAAANPYGNQPSSKLNFESWLWPRIDSRGQLITPWSDNDNSFTSWMERALQGQSTIQRYKAEEEGKGNEGVDEVKDEEVEGGVQGNGQGNEDETKKKKTAKERWDAWKGGITNSLKHLNWPNISDLSRAITAQSYANRSNELFRKGYDALARTQIQAPQAPHRRLDVSDIERQRVNGLAPFLDSRFVTSDGKLSAAWSLEQSKNAARLNADFDNQVTNRVNETNEINRNVDVYNNNANVQRANEYSKWITNIEMQRAANAAAKVNSDYANIWGPYLQQGAQNSRNVYNQLRAINLETEDAKLQAERDATINNGLVELRAKYNALEAETKKHTSFEDWVLADAEMAATYNDVRSNAYDTYRQKLQQAKTNYATSGGPRWYWKELDQFKSGGKVSKKEEQRRPYLETIAINSDKQAKQSAAKMTDHLMKMLQQLMK